MGGTPTGGAADPYTSSILNQMRYDNVVAGKPVYGGSDYALSALSNIGGGRGLIPALLGGLGQVYMANKANKAYNEASIQSENNRRKSQATVGAMAGIDPELLQNIVGGDEATLAKALELQGNASAGQNTNNMIQYMQGQNPKMGDIPQMQGNVPMSYQNDYLQKLWHYAETLPGMEGQNLKNKIQEATMQSEIAGTNAKNTADARFAIPQAQANLSGKQLSNQGQAIDNRYAPQIKQGTINNQRLNMENMQNNLLHKSQAQALGVTLQKIQAENPDPVVFRGLGMDLLRKSNLPPEGIKAGMDSIDNMIIMKNEADKARTIQQQQTTPQQKPGLFGIHF